MDSVELEAYRTRFSDVRKGLASQVDGGMNLIDELLKELSWTKTALEQTKLDLDNEREARRRLQQDAQENKDWKEQLESRPHIVALIDADADGYVFHDDYITMAEKGGENAADSLLAALQQFVRDMAGIPSGIDILVRAYANVGGLGKALERGKRVNDVGQFRAFTKGFSNRQAFFDFIDVGSGKERADFKVREL
ncbi:hypothetical protein IF1G_11060 [Cordyceps javanica]|uniref:DUF7923 domain-containing protein n=1 Tax=Cordyceps javanica TaxID=43265 RepID=A0A545ULG1_9HYPO|nr:hypothetical protein IF1G_11060 [Cordyceps javanica]